MLQAAIGRTQDAAIHRNQMRGKHYSGGSGIEFHRTRVSLKQSAEFLFDFGNMAVLADLIGFQRFVGFRKMVGERGAAPRTRDSRLGIDDNRLRLNELVSEQWR